MHNIKKVLIVILILFSFVLLYNPIITGFANITTLFRKDNSHELMSSLYQEKITSLELAISNYEKAMNELKIYDGSVYVLSKIAIRNIYDFYDFLIVSTDTKVNRGMAVVNEDGLVGFVESSNKSTAKVELITGDVSISVQVNDSFGILDGYDKEENLFLVHNIHNYTVINEGDEVLTSGLQEIDKNLHIGYVERVENTGVENLIYVKPSVDFNNLNYLVVINR